MAPGALQPVLIVLVIERWNARASSLEDAGIYLRYKLDRKLFRRYTRNAEEVKVNECQFADDAALLATTKRGAELITTEYMLVGKDFGLTLSIPKTKVMAVGREVAAENRTPLSVGEEEIESVEFPYLGSQIEYSGRVMLDVETRIAQASKAFGALRKSVLLDSDLKSSQNAKCTKPACCLYSSLGQSAGHH